LSGIIAAGTSSHNIRNDPHAQLTTEHPMPPTRRQRTPITSKIVGDIANKLPRFDITDPAVSILLGLQSTLGDYEFIRAKLARTLHTIVGDAQQALIQVSADPPARQQLPNACGILQQAAQVEILNGRLHASHAATTTLLNMAERLGQQPDPTTIRYFVP
jgi:hypothetical protein